MTKYEKRHCEMLLILRKVFPTKGKKPAHDIVSVTPIPREEVSFRRISMDDVGPIDPVTAAGHKYCLCIVDSCTK